MNKRGTIAAYYRCYKEADRASLRGILAPDVHHISAFSEYSDRDEMLDDIWPSVGESWTRDLRIFGEDPEFMVRYEVEAEE